MVTDKTLRKQFYDNITVILKVFDFRIVCIIIHISYVTKINNNSKYYIAIK